MIVQDFYIPEYDWEVRVYYAVDCYYTGRIMADLRRVGCRGADLMDAFRNMRSCNLNTGITYSNTRDRQTVMVIALTSSPGEFQNSWDHEKGHLCRHISKAFGIDPLYINVVSVGIVEDTFYFFFHDWNHNFLYILFSQL